MNKKAQDVLNESIKFLENDQIIEAEAGFNTLLNANPEHPDILFYVASCVMKRGFNALASHILKLVIERDPGAIAAYNNLGFIAKSENKDEEAKQYFKKAIKLGREAKISDHDLADMLSNLGTMYVNNGTPSKALDCLNEAIKLEDSPRSRWNRALAYLELKLWKKGWLDYESGFGMDGKRKIKFRDLPEWNGEKGKVVVYGEQGLGDEIMFASMLNDLEKTNEVVYDCHPRLPNIMRNSFDFPVYGTRKDKDMAWLSWEKPEYKIAIGSLGKFFRTKDEDFPGTPYMKPDTLLSEKLKERLTGFKRPIIGLSWKGGYKVTRKDLRSIPLTEWGDILTLDAEFISLQYTKGADKEAREAEEKFGIKIHHWQDVIDDYDLTAALLPHLDSVVSVCTSIIHLSGAMGIPCHVLTPSKPAWRYNLKGDMVWYNSVKLHRQVDEWKPVFKSIREDLCSYLKTIAA